MKKLGIAGILALLIVLSIFSVSAQELDATTSGGRGYGVVQIMPARDIAIAKEPTEIVIISGSDTITSEETSTGEVEIEPILIDSTGKEFRPISAQPLIKPFRFNIVDLTIRLVELFTERLDLTKENTIGELLEKLRKLNSLQDIELIESIREELELPEGATNGEIIQEWREDRLEQAIEDLELPEDSSPKEVLEAVKEERVLQLKENLGLEEEASKEEIKEAFKEWKDENKPVIRAWFNRLFYWRL